MLRCFPRWDEGERKGTGRGDSCEGAFGLWFMVFDCSLFLISSLPFPLFPPRSLLWKGFSGWIVLWWNTRTHEWRSLMRRWWGCRWGRRRRRRRGRRRREGGDGGGRKACICRSVIQLTHLSPWPYSLSYSFSLLLLLPLFLLLPLRLFLFFLSLVR